MTDLASTSCPCGSGRFYHQCCQPLHTGEQVATTPEALMRSRYAAFALGNLGQYLLDTWHVSKRQGLSASELSRRDTDWQRLQVLNSSVQEDSGEVEFRAFFSENNALKVLHERSRFVREQGRWFYVDGVINPPAVSRQTGRNDPCPCGSGKKFKKCCGQ
ncbi:YchJ family protein [Pokkaliibacter plantistimulans]|nr:YchJ family protein [Pokkaliibacter plantistimulans]